MLITRTQWQRRAMNGPDWSGSDLSAHTGVPMARSVGWGEPVLELGIVDPEAKPLTEIADGFRFELAADRLIQFERRPTVAFPGGGSWSPEFGALVIEFLLNGKPGAADRVDGEFWFPVKWRSLDPALEFLYQGELDQESEEPGEVRTRPAWVLGSYAIYKAGRKLGHVPRPFARDSQGTGLWGRWAGNPQSGVLYKAFPLAELDALIPPLVIDATFGYESQGGSSSTPSNGIQRANGRYDPGASWNAATIKMYTAAASGTLGSTAGIFSDDGNPPVSLAANVLRDSAEITLTTSAGWYTYTLDSVYGVVNGTDYHIGWHNAATGQQKYWYDSDGVTEDLTYETISYSAGSLSNFSSPSVAENRKVSIYVIEEEPAAITGNCSQICPRWWA